MATLQWAAVKRGGRRAGGGRRGIAQGDARRHGRAIPDGSTLHSGHALPSSPFSLLSTPLKNPFSDGNSPSGKGHFLTE